MNMVIRQAETDEDIQNCFDVISQLRPHLKVDEFVSVVRTQIQDGYRLACVLENNEVVAVAGFRINRSLSWGKYLYVDDLITAEDKRSRGFGKALLRWLKDEANNQGCGQLHLDSGVQRKDAHRFYEREGLALPAYHFVCMIDSHQNKA